MVQKIKSLTSFRLMSEKKFPITFNFIAEWLHPDQPRSGEQDDLDD